MENGFGIISRLWYPIIDQLWAMVDTYVSLYVDLLVFVLFVHHLKDIIFVKIL